MSTRFKEIAAINYIITRAETDIFNATGTRMRLIACKDVTEIGHSLEDFLNVVANSLGMTYNDYLDSTKNTEYIHLRYLGIALAKEYYPYITLKQLGAIMAKDHSTIINALRQHKLFMESEHTIYRAKYENALNAITQWQQE